MNMYHYETYAAVNHFLQLIEAAKSDHGSDHWHASVDIECVILIDADIREGSSYEARYYLVDHSTRVIFWMSEFSAHDLFYDVDSVNDMSHVRESWYFNISEKASQHHPLYKI
jgi:hypothetical protein